MVFFSTRLQLVVVVKMKIAWPDSSATETGVFNGKSANNFQTVLRITLAMLQQEIVSEFE